MNPLNFLYSGLAGMALGSLLTFIPMEKMYLSYKATVEAVGKQQEELTKRIAAQHKQVKEDLDARYKAMVDRDTARIASLRVQLANERKERFVPAPSPSSQGDNRVCYPADELDRRIKASLERLSERIAGIAERGQEAVNVASTCREWVGRIQ